MRGTAAGLLAAGLLILTGTTARAQDATNAGGQSTGSTAAPTTAAASQPAPDPPAPKPVTLTVGMDFPSAYMFRGLFQEDSGFIGQPFVDVGIAAYSGDGAVKSVTINAGIWNSFHSGPSGSGNDDDRSAWYEADFYGAVTFQVGKLEARRALHLLHQPERRVQQRPRAGRRARLRRQRQRVPAESQGDSRVRARRAGRRRQQQGHLSRAWRAAGGPARRPSEISADAGDSREVRPQPQGLLRGRDRQQHASATSISAAFSASRSRS